MADVIKIVVGPLVQHLLTLVEEEYSRIKGLRKDVKKLLSTLSTIQVVLQDAEEKQINSKPITLWLQKLKDAAYDADDILDAWSTQVRQSAPTSFSFAQIISRRKGAKKIKEILSRFNEIAEEKQQFHLNSSVAPQTGSQTKTTSRVTEPRVYGRDGDMQQITGMLLNNFSSQEVVSVYPILGIGGLGKTTLSQLVYNDERVVKWFEIRFWICVSEPFDIEMILKAIIEAFEKKKPDLENLESIQIKVGEILKGRRYLIVLDDVWNEDHGKWNDLKSFLGGGAKGSSIIVTTRLERTASLSGGRSIHRLRGLSDDDSLSLLKHRALGDMTEFDANLIRVAKDIVRKCQGVPLAVKSLGSLLGKKIDERYWKFIRDSEIWNLEENGENRILPALRLSYNHLPSRLKQCFAYCSIFPKDHEIEKNKLISLWMASGFIQPQRNMDLEEEGDDVFNALLMLSFFQDTIEDDRGNITKCKMHDLMHDLACSVAVDECLIAKIGDAKDVPKSIRHLSLFSDSADFDSFQDTTDVDACLESEPSLRSLCFFTSINFHSFKFPTTLRVLDLCVRTIEILPESICHLKQLRYLDLTHNWSLKSLPNSIGRLRNLESFILKDCQSLKGLPESIGNLSCLRQLDVSGCRSLKQMPVGIGKLKCLRALNMFFKKAPNYVCAGMEQLQGLNELRELKLERLHNLQHAKWTNLRSAQYLTKLELHWDLSFDSSTRVKNSKEVLQKLQLPPNLQQLVIRGYEWKKSFPQGFLRDLNALRSLTIENCDNLISLPEELQSLTFLVELKIRHCYQLTSLSEELCCLTSLQRLEILSCLKLQITTEDFQHLIFLRELHLENLPKLYSVTEDIQHLTMLKKLVIKNCEYLKPLPEKVKNWNILSYSPLMYILGDSGPYKRVPLDGSYFV